MLLVWALFPAALLAVSGLVLFFVIKVIQKVRGGRSGVGPAAAVPLLGCTAAPLGVLFLLLFGLPWLDSIRPAASDFEEAFGEAPVKGVTGLHGRTDAGIDSRTIFLALEDNAAANAQLARAFSNARSGPETDLLDGTVYSGNAPSWFEPICQGRTSAEYANWHQWHSAVVVRCASKRKIYALFSVVD